jgi:hypothetical protein
MKGYSMRALPFLLLLLLLPVVVFLSEQSQLIVGRARENPANIVVDTSSSIGPLPYTWKALAQGGEEKGTPMLGNILQQISVLTPRYIRIDHIYDFYNVVHTDSKGTLQFTWNELDQTVCQILQTGAKPFFSLGYMPPEISKDGTLIGVPIKWEHWQEIVQKTIERYSGQNMPICPGQTDDQLESVYYEVWNEPDLETFGKWNIHGGEKDYKLLYYYASEGAKKAQNTKPFFFGGPATTKPYQNWMQILLKYAQAYDMRMDFISWHHYSSETDDFAGDMVQVDQWLKGKEFEKYRSLPRIISEWGFDSNPNPIADTQVAGAHTVATIRHLVDQKLEMAFAFEIKDGVNPSWGILTRDGQTKPRYHALSLLNVLGPRRLNVQGEGTWVKALASRDFQNIALILVNYDKTGQHSEVVPVTFTGLIPSTSYRLIQRSLESEEANVVMQSSSTGILSRIVSMQPNSTYSIELIPE